MFIIDEGVKHDINPLIQLGGVSRALIIHIYGFNNSGWWCNNI